MKTRTRIGTLPLAVLTTLAATLIALPSKAQQRGDLPAEVTILREDQVVTGALISCCVHTELVTPKAEPVERG